MSDPLSIAGTAVGVVSLGIRVCHGLFNSIRTVRGRHGDIKDGIIEVQALLDVFESLNDMLPDFKKQDPETSALLLACLQKNEAKLLSLKQVLDDLNGSGISSGFKGKIKDTGRALMYPFRQEDLRLVQSAASRLLQSLQLGLQLATLKADGLQLERLDGIQSECASQGNAIAALGDSLHDNGDNIQSLRTTMTDFMSDISENLTEIKTGISGLAQSLGALKEDSNDLTEQVVKGMNDMKLLVVQADHRGQDHSKQLHRQLLAQMAMLQSIQSQLHVASSSPSLPSTYHSLPATYTPKDNADLQQATTSVITTTEKNILCTCTFTGQKSQTAKSSFRIPNLSVSWMRQDLGHSPRCPFSKIGKQTRKIVSARTQIRILSYFMGVVEVGLSYTAGLGGFQMAPFVRLKNIVPYDQSPVVHSILKLNNWIIKKPRSTNETVARLQKTQLDIVQLYQQGLSSPTDLTEYGDTHIMRLFRTVLATLSSGESGDPIIIGKCVGGMIKTLLECGVPTEDDLPQLILCLIFLPQRFRSVNEVEYENASHILRAMDPTLEDFRFSFSVVDLTRLLSPLPDVLDGMDIPPTIRAILSRSMSRLDREIVSYPKETLQVTHGLTTLLWSIGWPEGLRKLLQTGARVFLDTPGGWGTFMKCPIEAAVSLQCAESLDVLLEAGCAMFLGDNLACEREVFGTGTSFGCMAVIAKHLAERHKQLLILARAHLPVGLLRASWHRPDYVPDEDASELCSMLLGAGIPVSQSLRVPETFQGVYHLNVDVTSMPAFAEAGFLGYNSPSAIGLRPVMRSTGLMPWLLPPEGPSFRKTFEVVKWFTDLGCFDESPEDPKALSINTTATGWHFVAAMFGRTFWIFNDSRQSEYELAFAACSFLRQLLFKPSDGCTCWCSPGGNGCSPMNSLYKAHCRPSRTYRETYNISWTLHAFFHHPISDQTADSIEPPSPSKRSLELVRFLTFEALEMTHTCCAMSCLFHKYGDPSCLRPDDWPRDPCAEYIALKNCDAETVNRARDKEQDLAQQLESLMSEVTVQMANMPDSPRALENFVWGYWRRRISRLYSVNPDIIEEMSEILDEVKITCYTRADSKDARERLFIRR
ncbi:hypothetical protein QBC44DRAFT_327682 [Cladorrhinum sp. PSN332]|nr:hypothetical protein QBC44DRAFT_327682 [Cladorrhinum sp. PSN332]